MLCSFELIITSNIGILSNKQKYVLLANTVAKALRKTMNVVMHINVVTSPRSKFFCKEMELTYCLADISPAKMNNELLL